MGVLPEHITADDPPTVESPLDRAVREAGFATEPLRHCIRELYECLYLRMLFESNCPSQKEHDAMQDARRFLGLSG